MRSRKLALSCTRRIRASCDHRPPGTCAARHVAWRPSARRRRPVRRRHSAPPSGRRGCTRCRPGRRECAAGATNRPAGSSRARRCPFRVRSGARRPRCRGTTMPAPARSRGSQQLLSSLRPPPGQNPSRSGSPVSLRSRSYGNLTTMSSDSSGPDGQRPPYVGAMLACRLAVGPCSAVCGSRCGRIRRSERSACRALALSRPRGSTSESARGSCGDHETVGQRPARASRRTRVPIACPRFGRRSGSCDQTYRQGTAAPRDHLRRGGGGSAADRRDPRATSLRTAAQLA